MLRIKSLTVVTVSSILVFIFMFFYLKKSIDTDYKNLEILKSKSVYHLIDNEFKGIYKVLETSHIDWSKWDDTYEFIKGDDKIKEDYIKSNLSFDILSDLDLDFIIFSDDSGKIIYEKSQDKFGNYKLPEKKINRIVKQISNYNGQTGMLIGEDKEIFIFSNFKITDSDNVKTTNSNLIMGYFLSQKRVMELEKKLGIQLNIGGVSEKLQIPYKITIGKNFIKNKMYIPTLTGESVVFENERAADILLLGKKNIKKYLIFLFINFMILVFAIYIFMEQIIVKRLKNMDNSVREIIECQDLKKRIKVSGKDEIANLGMNVNNLLEDIEVMRERLYTLATYDSMTGILNKHAGLEKIENLFDQAKRNNEGFIIAFVDINDLKYVNDKYSHKEGDELIKNIVKIICEKLKSEDVFFRFGGDEFILGFNRLNLLEVHLLFNEIEDNLENYKKDTQKEYEHSISVGVVECQEDKTLNEFINIADINMYENKRYKKKFPEKKYI